MKSPAVATTAGARSDAPAAKPLPRLSLSMQVTPQAGELPVSRAQVRRWARAALERDATLVIRLVGEEEGATLNGQFRQRSGPTNVLTFDYQTEPDVIADIVICMPVVHAEARAGRISVRDHLAHMVIHGVLHAHGFDHVEADEAELMEAREARLLARFGIANPYRAGS